MNKLRNLGIVELKFINEFYILRGGAEITSSSWRSDLGQICSI